MVAIPVYNAEPYLDESISSIVGQDYTGWHMIIVDDGSTDGSGDIADAWAARDPRIRVIHTENQGPGLARNVAIAACNTEFIAFQDADDISLPDRLSAQLALLQSDAELGSVGGGLIDWDSVSGRTSLRRLPNRAEMEKEQRSYNLAIPPFPSGVTMVRVAALRAVGGFRSIRPAEDSDLGIRLAELYPLDNLFQPVLRYRYVAGSEWRGNPLASACASILCVESAAARRAGLVDPIDSLTLPVGLEHITELDIPPERLSWAYSELLLTMLDSQKPLPQQWLEIILNNLARNTMPPSQTQCALYRAALYRMRQGDIVGGLRLVRGAFALHPFGFVDCAFAECATSVARLCAATVVRRRAA